MNLVFTNYSEEDVIYPLTVKEIAEAQQADSNIHKLTKCTKYTTQLVDHMQVLCKDTAMALPAALQHRAVS